MTPDAEEHRELRQAPVDVVRARAGDPLARRRARRRTGGGGDAHRRAASGQGRGRVKNGRRNSVETRRAGPERAVIAALRRPSQRRSHVEESLEELAGLARAAGAAVVQRVLQERPAATPALYFGRGKVDAIGELVRANGATLLIADDPLTPVQERNLSQALGIKVIDRTALILDIFAQRARTSEGKLQVELAQLTYLLPRLVGQWTHLERLGGGIGTRGPGETQLESDRRVIRRRLMQIRRELEQVRVHRRVQREGRRRAGLPVVALVGYTNAGKTTLLNRLTGARLTTADQLFVTLDPAARLVDGGLHQPFILTDTVGFIRKLPHELVAAFRATLEELRDADLLLHVVDAGHPALDEHVAAVKGLLEELAVADRPTILVLNKIDRLETPWALERVLVARDGVPVSAANGEGLEGLRAAVEAGLRAGRATVRLRIPHGDGTALALCYERGRVLARADEGEHVEVEVELPA
ncbi:MAG: GTPase HflX, partial [Candidatus Rokubacteria bacterium]|nr:GTPase HflX [Candidatus Rokubacteria bacterium]